MPPGPIHKKCLGLYPHRAGSKAPLPGGAAAENDEVVPLMEKLLALLLGLVLRKPLIRMNEFFEERLNSTKLM